MALRSPFAFTQDELDLQAPMPGLGPAAIMGIDDGDPRGPDPRDPRDPAPPLPPGPGQPVPPGPVPEDEEVPGRPRRPRAPAPMPEPEPLPEEQFDLVPDMIPEPVPLPAPPPQTPTGIGGTFSLPAQFGARSTAGGGPPEGTSAYGPGAPLAPASGQRSDQMSDEELLRAITRKR